MCVESVFGEVEEVPDGVGCLIGAHDERDVSCGGVEDDDGFLIDAESAHDALGGGWLLPTDDFGGTPIVLEDWFGSGDEGFKDEC